MFEIRLRKKQNNQIITYIVERTLEKSMRNHEAPRPLIKFIPPLGGLEPKELL